MRSSSTKSLVQRPNTDKHFMCVCMCEQNYRSITNHLRDRAIIYGISVSTNKDKEILLFYHRELSGEEVQMLTYLTSLYYNISSLYSV